MRVSATCSTPTVSSNGDRRRHAVFASVGFSGCCDLTAAAAAPTRRRCLSWRLWPLSVTRRCLTVRQTRPAHCSVRNGSRQADNWFVSDTGQLFLPVGGVLVSFAQGARADWARYGVAPERVTALEGFSNAFRIATSSDAESLRLVKQLAGMPGVESVTPDMFTPDSTGDTESPKRSSYNFPDSVANSLCKSDDPSTE